VRVLSSALRWHRGGRALQDLQQRLLHTLTGDITGDRRIFALARDLVDLIDVDDARLGLLDVIVGGLDQLEQDVLDVFADIARLGESRGVSDRERHIEHAGKGLGKISLAASGWTDEQDVGLGKLNLVILAAGGRSLRLNTLVMVVNRHRERLLCAILADHIAVEEVVDLLRLGKLSEAELSTFGELFLDDLVAQIDTFVADVDTRTSDELLDLLLALAAERALQQIGSFTNACHVKGPLDRCVLPVTSWASISP